jgi:hypothetical protein
MLLNKKTTQKGGFLNMLFGNEKGGSTEQPSQSPGIFASVGNFFGNVTQKGEELLTKGQDKLQEGLSTVGDTVSKSRENLGNVISGKPAEDSTTMAPQTPMGASQPPMANNQPSMANNQMNMAVNQPPMDTNQMNMDAQMDMEKRNAMAGITSGGRKKKVLKGGRGLGLMYYATPVYDSNVAQPTYWMTGGKRRRSTFKRRNSKKSRKTRRKRR